MRFSQRIGKKSVRESLQVESIDIPLENKLWNCFLNDFKDNLNPRELEQVYKKIWLDFFERCIDDIPQKPTNFRGNNKRIIDEELILEKIKKHFFASQWFEKYDFIEFLSEVEEVLNINFSYTHLTFSDKCNEVLKKEHSAYRLVKN